MLMRLFVVLVALAASAPYSVGLNEDHPAAFDKDYFAMHLEELRNEDDRTFDKLRDDEFSHADRVQRLEQYFNEYFESPLASIKLKSLSIGSIESVFEAVELASYYSPRPKYTGYMRELLSILEGRGAATKDHKISLLESFISIRDFDSAISFAEQNSLDYNLPKLVRSRTSGLSSEDRKVFWRFSAGTDGLLQETVTESALNELIVVVAGPKCHFSRRAAEDIFSSSAIQAERFGKAAIWLMPPGGDISLDAVGEFQRISSNLQFGLFHNWDGWPEIKERGMPTFYFFRDGALVETLVGWKGESSMAKLMRILESNNYDVLTSTAKQDD